MPAASPPRRVGFDRPLSSNQVWSWIGNACATGFFYALAALILLQPKRHCDEGALALIVVPHACCVAVGLGCWLFLETHPPTEASCFARLLPDSRRWTKSRYCREHKATIEGLDHFCTWLNVSIGRNNYVPFFVLAAAGTFQYALNAAAAAYVLAAGCRRGRSTALLVGVGSSGVFALCILAAYAALFGFHAYLAYRGMGTYDWILDQRDVPAPPPRTASTELKAMTARVGDGVPPEA